MILPAMLAAWLTGVNCHAQEPAQNAATSTEELAKAAQNPVANLISVPFQNNFNFGIGPNEVTQWDLNVQPVIPISLNEDWNLITRTIIPIIDQPSARARRAERVRPGRHQPAVLFLARKTGQVDLGRRADVHFSNGDRIHA